MDSSLARGSGTDAKVEDKTEQVHKSITFLVPVCTLSEPMSNHREHQIH